MATESKLLFDNRFPAPMDGIAVLAAAANVIMQLSWPEIGYGVYESRVESGRLFDHPIKRTRTTLTYLAVAACGTDKERAAFRRATNRAHARVRSTADSPVAYNAFDPELQRWVAACLYRGFEDVHTAMFGPIASNDREKIYRAGAVFGTTLQMPQDMWPATRDDFENYWNNSLSRVSIDDTIREHLLSIARGEFAGRLISGTLGPLNLYFTTAFLPEYFRDEMGLPWDDKQQRRFERIMRTCGLISKPMPMAARELPYRLLLRDMRRRIGNGTALV